MLNRIIIDILIFFAVLFLPPIFSVVVALFFLYYFKSFYEIIFIGLIIDILYGRPIANFYDFSYPATSIFGVLLISSIFIKKRLKFYSNK